MRYDKTYAILIMGFVSPLVGAQSNIDPANKHAWNENAGYSNWLAGGTAFRGCAVFPFDGSAGASDGPAARGVYLDGDRRGGQ